MAKGTVKIKYLTSGSDHSYGDILDVSAEVADAWIGGGIACIAPDADVAAAEIKKRDDELATLRATVEGLERENENLRGKVAKLEGQVLGAEAERDQAKADADAARNDRAQAHADLKQAHAAAADFRDQAHELGRQLAAATGVEVPAEEKSAADPPPAPAAKGKGKGKAKA